MRLSRIPLLAAAILAAALPAQAGWTSLGRMGAPTREGASLVFRNEQGVVAVTAVDAHVLRVRFAPGTSLGRDHSYAILERGPGDPAARFAIGTAESRLETAALRVTARHDPFRLSFTAADGTSLDDDDPERGMAFAGREVRVWKRLRDDEHVYGLGEKTGDLDKRGRKLGGSSVAMWNSDTFAYHDGTDPIYASVPFYLVLRRGRAHGIFLDNTFRSSFDVGRQSQDLLSFGAEAGELDYYLIEGPTPKEVVERYTALTGRTPLPPLWALGYHQCRYSYYPESRVRFIAQNFRERKIPADVIWLDIHYLDGFRPFTWDRQRFPDPAALMRDLRADGFRVVTIVDPHPAKQPGAVPYETGLAGGHFVKNPDGSLYEAPVWPSQAERDPSPSLFPDFSRPATRDWWGSLYGPLLDAGVAGIWNDMNEPAIFDVPSGTMPLDVQHDNEGQRSDHREVHNVYGMLMTRATHEGLARLRPQERPFVLTRASFAGGQRWSAIWPGDNVSDWQQLRMTIPMFANMGISGWPFVGADIGGFEAAPTPELFTRWLQLGVFYPFMRTHTVIGSPDQEPWSYGIRHEELNRRAIELRYELLPTLYNLMEEASRTGVSPFRPLFLEFPEDAGGYGQQDEFLFGRDLLVAPVLREAVQEREVYFPPGEWRDYWTGRVFTGPGRERVPVTLESIPMFVRAGGALFRQPVLQHTGQAPDRLDVVLAAPTAGQEESSASLYEDAGQGFAYREGGFLRRTFHQRRTPAGLAVEVTAPEGRYRPTRGTLRLLVRGVAASRVLLGGEVLPRREGSAFYTGGPGWTVAEDGTIIVKVAERWDAFTVRLER